MYLSFNHQISGERAKAFQGKSQKHFSKFLFLFDSTQNPPINIPFQQKAIFSLRKPVLTSVPSEDNFQTKLQPNLSKVFSDQNLI